MRSQRYAQHEERNLRQLTAYPVDWLLFDWFVYGHLRPNDFAVQPAWFVNEPFVEIIGRLDGGHCDPNNWRKWVACGCDLFGYAWGTPPDFHPHPSYAASLKITREAFAALPGWPIEGEDA